MGKYWYIECGLIPLDWPIDHFGKYHNTLCLPPKFCISIVFVFSWDHCKSQAKLETILMQNLGGQTKSIKVFSEAGYWPCLHAAVNKRRYACRHNCNNSASKWKTSRISTFFNPVACLVDTFSTLERLLDIRSQVTFHFCGSVLHVHSQLKDD